MCITFVEKGMESGRRDNQLNTIEMNTYPKHKATCKLYGVIDVYDKLSDKLVAEVKVIASGRIARFFWIKGDGVGHTGFLLNLTKLSKEKIQYAIENLGRYGLADEAEAIEGYIKSLL